MTYEGEDEDADVGDEAGGGFDEEDGNGTDEDDGGGDGGGEKQLHGDDGVNLADEGPPELRAVHHDGIKLVIF